MSRVDRLLKKASRLSKKINDLKIKKENLLVEYEYWKSQQEDSDDGEDYVIEE